MRKITVTAILCFLLTLCLCVTAGAASYEGYTQSEFDALAQTTVIRSEDSPTGYYVTFRFPNDNYHLVQVYGEWSFSDISYSTSITGEDKGPEEWEDGDTVWHAGSWPTADMTLNAQTDTWSYTIPLPNGTWKYRFVVTPSEGAETYMAYDPYNPPYLANEETMTGEHYLTSVYVPWDEVRQAKTVRVDEEAPREDQKGTVFFETVTLESGLSTSYGVYLPYGFDVNRAEPYKILVLYHGGGGFEGSWFNNGMINIMDNMIAEGRVEPMVVVTPCGEDFRSTTNTQIWERYECLDYVVNTILPHMVEQYNVSTEQADRAISGLSQGGATIMHGYFNWTDEFKYYICMSAPMRAGVDPDFTKPELKDVNLFFGIGLYDHVITRAFYNENVAANESSMYDYLYGLDDAGVGFRVNINLPYGHDWVLWRKLLVEGLEEFLWK
ncbi:MAG: alpha/beta hydrolase-fold protein [Clostridia bacterium]|nr:alpha/beta hydrolase-fold protein [Clostridia bacterium]